MCRENSSIILQEIVCFFLCYILSVHVAFDTCGLNIKNTNACHSSVYFLIINSHHPFSLCKTHQAAAPCVFGCLSAQHETYALLAPFSDKSTAMIAITESEGDLITLPTSRQHWLPSIWRLFCYIITAVIPAITMFHKLEMCVNGSLAATVTAGKIMFIFSYLRYHLNSFFKKMCLKSQVTTSYQAHWPDIYANKCAGLHYWYKRAVCLNTKNLV